MNKARNLKGNEQNYSISEQLPKSIQERRLAQLPELKRQKQSDSSAKLIRDKLIVQQRYVNPMFEHNTVIPLTGKHYIYPHFGKPSVKQHSHREK